MAKRYVDHLVLNCERTSSVTTPVDASQFLCARSRRMSAVRGRKLQQTESNASSWSDSGSRGSERVQISWLSPVRAPTSSERSTIDGSTTGRCRSFSLPLESRLIGPCRRAKSLTPATDRAHSERVQISWLSPVREPTSSERSTIDGSTTGRCRSFTLPLESRLIGPCRRAESLTPATDRAHSERVQISWLSPVREPTSSERSTIDGSTTGRCRSFSLPLESRLIGPCHFKTNSYITQIIQN